MTETVSLIDFPDLPSGLSQHAPPVASGLSANVTELASAFQMVATPLLLSLPKRIVVDQKNGDLYASKSSEVMKTRGWSFFEQEQQEVLAERITTLKVASSLPSSLESRGAPQEESQGNSAQLARLFTQLRAVRSYSERAKELWSTIKAYEVGIETKSDTNVTTAMTSDELDRSVLEDILDDVESALKKDSNLLDDAAREELKQMRLMLDMARDASLYAKEAKETYEMLQKKVKDEGLLEQTEGIAGV